MERSTRAAAAALIGGSEAGGMPRPLRVLKLQATQERAVQLRAPIGVDGYCTGWYTLPSRLLHGQRACVDCKEMQSDANDQPAGAQGPNARNEEDESAGP